MAQVVTHPVVVDVCAGKVEGVVAVCQGAGYSEVQREVGGVCQMIEGAVAQDAAVVDAQVRCQRVLVAGEVDRQVLGTAVVVDRRLWRDVEGLVQLGDYCYVDKAGRGNVSDCYVGYPGRD